MKTRFVRECPRLSANAHHNFTAARSRGAALVLQMAVIAAAAIIVGVVDGALRPLPPRVTPQATPNSENTVPAPDRLPQPLVDQAAPPTNPAATQPSGGDPLAGLPVQGMVDVTIAQAKALWDKGVPFIDGRQPAERRDWVRESVHLTRDMLMTSEGVATAEQFDRESPVVVYCNGPECHESHLLAELLSAAGFKTVYVMTDGIEAWRNAGYAVDAAP